ncbi:MAG: response regulator [Firmicutes bacterium]|nr:response regulator [Bacillota bacterium]
MKDVSLLVNNGVNVDGSLELFGDMEMYNETLEDFLKSVEKKLADIKRYKEAADMPNYAILVHSLKSDSKYLGFTKLAELSYNHELKSKENDISYVYNNYDELLKEANRIVNLVKEYMGLPVVKEDESTEPSVKDKTILVVDDSNIIRNFIKKIFNNHYEVIVANDGKEAIDAIELNPNVNIVAMLLDLNMPNVNGFEVLEYFDKYSLFSRIPVSIITGDDYRETVEKIFAYPVVDILNKPFNERDIKQIVEKTVNRKN